VALSSDLRYVPTTTASTGADGVADSQTPVGSAGNQDPLAGHRTNYFNSDASQ
jgi:hypothetical protein